MTTYAVEQLIEHGYTSRSLPASLLFAPKPLNGLGDISTVAIFNEDSKQPVAFGAFNHYAPALAYCMLNAIDPALANKSVHVRHLTKKVGKRVAKHQCLEIEQVEELKPNDPFEPQFLRAFCIPEGRLLLQHMIDALIESTVGELNFDLKKNVTVDLYANELENESVVEENRFWRDYAGFVVSDRHLYREFTINRLKLKEILNKDQIIDNSIQVVSPANKQLIFDYDSSMATFNREEYIQYLLSLNDVNGVVSIDKSGQANGYALAYGGRIFQIYAGNEEIASALLHRLVMEMQTEEVVFYARDARWIAKEIAGNAKRVRLIRRFHTRLIPAQVKWDRVYALNVGLHVF